MLLQEIDWIPLAKELLHVRLLMISIEPLSSLLDHHGLPVGPSVRFFYYAAAIFAYDELQYPIPATAKARNYRIFLSRLYGIYWMASFASILCIRSRQLATTGLDITTPLQELQMSNLRLLHHKHPSTTSPCMLHLSLRLRPQSLLSLRVFV